MKPRADFGLRRARSSRGAARTLALTLCVLPALACTTRPSGTTGAAPVAPETTFSSAGAEAFHPERAVTGFPFPIRLVFEGEATVPISTGLFAADNPFSITLRPAADRDDATLRSSSLRSTRAAYVFPVRISRRALLGPVGRRRPGREGRRERSHLPPTFALPEGRTCEIVLDLSGLTCLREKEGGEAEICRYRWIKPGAYALEIAHRALAFKTPAKRVELIAPTLPEHRLLARLQNLGPSESTWETFVLRSPELTEGIDLAELGPEASSQLAYHLLLARLVHSEKPVAGLAITDATALTMLPAYRTEALLLRYEIELARGAHDSADETREAILAARPYAREALERIAERGGLIARFRRRVGARPAALRQSAQGGIPSPSRGAAE